MEGVNIKVSSREDAEILLQFAQYNDIYMFDKHTFVDQYESRKELFLWFQNGIHKSKTITNGYLTRAIEEGATPLTVQQLVTNNIVKRELRR